VVSVEVTDEETHDSQKAEELVETTRQKAKEKCKKVEKVIADRGYDTHRDCFKICVNYTTPHSLPSKRIINWAHIISQSLKGFFHFSYKSIATP